MDNWTQDQVKQGREIILDGAAVEPGCPCREIFWRPGEREKRETDRGWRMAQRIMTRRNLQ